MKNISKKLRLNSKAAAEMRVAIANDVIQQILAGQYTAASGIYFDWKRRYFSLVNQSLLCDSSNTCNVCGVGAALASAVRLYNGTELDFGQLGQLGQLSQLGQLGRASVCNTLKPYFSIRQLALIEAVFEPERKRTIAQARPALAPKGEELRRAESFRNSFDSPQERMLGIYRNIVFNNGTFRP